MILSYGSDVNKQPNCQILIQLGEGGKFVLPAGPNDFSVKNQHQKISMKNDSNWRKTQSPPVWTPDDVILL